jgi:SHS2 domain-containing protein
MDTHVWQALPPRKKRSRASAAETAGESVGSGSCNETSSSSSATSSHDGTQEGSTAERNRDQIDANVQARSELKRANATLEAKDGCAGEFYEYLDHTADVQCHCWGKTLSDAFANMVPCMFNYITDLSTVEVNLDKTIEFTVKGHDLESLLFTYMDEFLFRFCTDGFCCVRVEILGFDREKFEIQLKAFGESFDPTKHPQGTEIKAITYSNMQIHETDEKADLYVIVDI